jgi:hypothetical protein
VIGRHGLPVTPRAVATPECRAHPRCPAASKTSRQTKAPADRSAFPLGPPQFSCLKAVTVRVDRRRRYRGWGLENGRCAGLALARPRLHFSIGRGSVCGGQRAISLPANTPPHSRLSDQCFSRLSAPSQSFAWRAALASRRTTIIGERAARGLELVPGLVKRCRQSLSCFGIKGCFLKQSNDWHVGPPSRFWGIGCRC